MYIYFSESWQNLFHIFLYEQKCNLEFLYYYYSIFWITGATAQGEVNTETKEFLDWSDSNKYEGHVEVKLGSFNETLPTQVMELYNVSDHWQEYAFMISDIRTVCPVQELAQYATKHFVENVSFYVATQPKSDSLGGNFIILL